MNHGLKFCGTKGCRGKKCEVSFSDGSILKTHKPKAYVERVTKENNDAANNYSNRVIRESAETLQNKLENLSKFQNRIELSKFFTNFQIAYSNYRTDHKNNNALKEIINSYIPYLGYTLINDEGTKIQTLFQKIVSELDKSKIDEDLFMIFKTLSEDKNL